MAQRGLNQVQLQSRKIIQRAWHDVCELVYLEKVYILIRFLKEGAEQL